MKIEIMKFYACRSFLKEVAFPCCLLLALVASLSVLSNSAASNSQGQVLSKCFKAGADIISEEVFSVISRYGVVL